MEDEYARYRQSNMKGKMQISKRFTKYYIRDFIGVTNLEISDQSRSKNMYRAFTVGGAVTFGYMSFKMRRLQIGALGENLAPIKDTTLASSILNDCLAGLVGYLFGHFLSMDYIYK